jgi:hypothetical protein
MPLAVASSVSGFELSWGKARTLSTLSRAINSKKPMANFSFRKTEFLICVISIHPSGGAVFLCRQPECKAIDVPEAVRDEKSWKSLAHLGMR